MKTLLLFAAGLLLTASAPAQHRPRRPTWRGFSGPAYLPPLARRPSQHRLDSLATAARRRALLTAR